MKIIIPVLAFSLVFLICSCSGLSEANLRDTPINIKVASESESKFSLKAGDILVRPNYSWMPGSSEIGDGYKFGHAGIVVVGAEGDSIQEVLAKALLIEAHIYDRATKKFIFGSPSQVFRTKAIITFDKKFAGNRYRLRINLSDDQITRMIQLLNGQVGFGQYELFSKRSELIRFGQKQEKAFSYLPFKWNCSSLVWFAYYYSAGLDIDSNGGEYIYPNDLITCTLFDVPNGRYRF